MSDDQPVRPRRWPRVLRRSVAAVLAVALVLAGVATWLVRRSFPQDDGVVAVPGLGATVTVYRDSHAVPQIYAHTGDDLYRAQGYVHAQERFWEMDFRRHVTAGRLAELFGPSQLATDEYLRTLGWRRVAAQEWPLVAESTRRALTAYTAGVNAWLAGHKGGAASLEYTVLGLRNSGYRIEPWSPVDSLAWLKAMAWDLRSNMTDEIERSVLLGAGLTRAQVEQLYPAYPGDRNPPIVAGGTIVNGRFAATGASAPAAGQGGGGPVDAVTRAAPLLGRVGQRMAALPQLFGPMGSGIGSNSFVLAGSRTTTGKPILENDPHLGPSMPAIWFQVGLHCDCGLNVSGYSFSGVPGVVIGHNDRVAWGFTNLGPDVSDLYLEQVRGDTYLADGQWRPMRTRRETIRVAGAAPVTITVRSTRNGPVLSDQDSGLRGIGAAAPVDPSGTQTPAATAADPAYAVSLRWTALDPGRTMDALFTLDAARGWADFRAAASQFEVPAQNLVYADVDGNIGYQAPGKIPVRGRGDGRWPVPGWDPAYQWTGSIPFDELPSVLDPADGYVVTANQQVVGPGYPLLLTDDWSYGYRSARLQQLITGHTGRISVSDVTTMQMDARNGMAPTLVPYLAKIPLTGRAAKAQKLLGGWDFQQPADGAAGSAAAHSSAAAAYYNAVWRHLLARAFDELPAQHRPTGGDRWFEVVRGLLGQPDSPWWDVRATPQRETRDDILADAMRDAAAELGRRLGDDPAAWRWGALHTLTVRNESFGESGVGPVEWLFNEGPVGTSGGEDLVDATGWDATVGYEVDWVPSMRMVVDLSDLDRSRWVQLMGESGHAFNAQYHDQFELWRTGRTLPMRWQRATVEREAAHALRLRP